MGIESSMYAGISGLNASAQQMSVIGNNLANVDTVGYKQQTINFEDLVYASTPTGAGTGQLGQGVGVEDISTDFSQTGYQTTTNPTDLAVSGNGFFVVKDPNTNAQYYTRAGNFSIDKNGYLINPQDDVVQGYQVDNNALRADEASGQTVTQVPTEGALTDIKTDVLSLAAQSTSAISLASNLNSESTAGSTSTTEPFFSMFQNYDYNSKQPTTSPLASTAFDYQNTVTVYDQRGGSHTVSVYYDKVSDVGGKEYWQYMVTTTPSDDGRTFDINGTQTAMNSNSKAGVLMLGTMVFDDTGKLQNETAYTLNSNSLSNPVSNLSDWSLARLSSSGYPVFTANFRGVSGANTTSASNAVSMSLNLGMHATGTTWNTTATTADQIGLSHLSNASLLQGFNPATAIVNTTATTNYDAASTTVLQSQDGYAPGTLQSVAVDGNGVLSGTYSNGQDRPLYVIALATFRSEWGLTRDGSNLFSQSLASGDALIGRANTGTYGSIESDTLESSNVDMASEMVSMITTQRAYEANSKTITTADQLIQETLALKT
jgi:flagellar hook protein FlgE